MTGLQKQRTVADVFRHALKDDRLRLRLGILYFKQLKTFKRAEFSVKSQNKTDKTSGW